MNLYKILAATGLAVVFGAGMTSTTGNLSRAAAAGHRTMVAASASADPCGGGSDGGQDGNGGGSNAWGGGDQGNCPHPPSCPGGSDVPGGQGLDCGGGGNSCVNCTPPKSCPDGGNYHSQDNSYDTGPCPSDVPDTTCGNATGGGDGNCSPGRPDNCDNCRAAGAEALGYGVVQVTATVAGVPAPV